MEEGADPRDPHGPLLLIHDSGWPPDRGVRADAAGGRNPLSGPPGLLTPVRWFNEWGAAWSNESLHVYQRPARRVSRLDKGDSGGSRRAGRRRHHRRLRTRLL